MTQADIQLTRNEAASQYEARVPGEAEIALAQYTRTGDRLHLTHTEVPEHLEGRGVGSALVQYALEDARAAGLSVIPSCPFVAAYIQRHPSFRELVPPDARSAFGL